jgi:3-methyladenine DNA glycosylase AlkD
MNDKVMQLVASLRAAFAAASNPDQAPAMQDYMKSAMPFHGIAAPQRRALVKEALRAVPGMDAAHTLAAAGALFDTAGAREEWYAACDLLANARMLRAMDPNQQIQCLALARHIIVRSAWWDVCDALSAEVIGVLLQRSPQTVGPTLLHWATAPSDTHDLWLARAAILAQRKRREDFDTALFYACIEPNLNHRDFFMKKGIGWALRERSYRAPDEVIAFCDTHREVMAPLTRREALRVILKNRDG